MNITLDKAYSIIEETIVKDLKHPYYERVTELAKLYKQLITGADIDDLFTQFVRREDEALFNQRKRLTQIITPAVSAAIKTPFAKVGRVNNIIRKITQKNGDTEKNITKIEDALKAYNGTKSLDAFMRSRFTNLSFSDPNSFIITEFDEVEVGPQGEMLSAVKPRPFIATSKQAINYFYDNGILKWIIVQLPCEYTKQDGTKHKGCSYTIYLSKYAIKFTQIDAGKFNRLEKEKYYQISNDSNELVDVFKADDSRVFVVKEYEHKSEIIPAIRVGYKPDEVTDDNTCVNPMHDGMPYFMKSIKTVSEFDITMCNHAFPQKFQYVNKCPGKTREIGCEGGQTIEGATCSVCNGSGISIHTSAQDAVLIRIPRDKSEMIDLAQMVHYVNPPIDLLEFQNDYIKQLSNEVRNAVFPTKSVIRTDGVKTATEMDYAYEDVYDALFPYSEHFSEVYRHIVKTAAYYLDINDIVVIYEFPKDFKFKSLSDLLNELKLSNDSNAPGYVRRELSNDIADQQFIDKPAELKRIRLKEKFYPFPDKTDAEILYIISNGKTTKYNEILWANFDNIFNEIESNEDISFYDLPFNKQKDIVKSQVEKTIKEIEESKSDLSISFTNNITNDENSDSQS